jgi:hypothetical protein
MLQDEKFSEMFHYFSMNDSVRYFYADRNEYLFRNFCNFCMRAGAFSGKLIGMYR